MADGPVELRKATGSQVEQTRFKQRFRASFWCVCMGQALEHDEILRDDLATKKKLSAKASKRQQQQVLQLQQLD